jgi:hypothetical protein
MQYDSIGWAVATVADGVLGLVFVRFLGQTKNTTMRPFISTFATALLVGASSVVAVFPIMPGDAAGAEPNRAPKAVEEAFRKLRVGMTYQEVERVIQPVLLDFARRGLGGSGHSDRIYHLRGDQQFVLSCGGHGKLDDVIAIGKLEPKKPWKYWGWDLGEKDQAAAVKIAADALRDELKAGRIPADRFATNPEGGYVFLNSLPVELEITSGKKTTLVARCDGRWDNHKLVWVDFYQAKTWIYQVYVDLNDLRPVPYSWTPTNEEIAGARIIADPAMQEFIGNEPVERAKVKVSGRGYYDYGPLRRTLVLDYEKPDEDGRLHRKGIVVDFDNMKLKYE